MKFNSDYMIDDYVDFYRKTFWIVSELVGEYYNVSTLFKLIPEAVFLIPDSYNGFLTEA